VELRALLTELNEDVAVSWDEVDWVMEATEGQVRSAPRPRCPLLPHRRSLRFVCRRFCASIYGIHSGGRQE
jgi:hypothetical protein